MAVAIEVLVQTRESGVASDHGDTFSDLYRRVMPELVAYCRRHSSDPEAAEDIAQEALLRAWKSWDQYSSARPFWPWVATIARRLCIDHHRRAGYAAACRSAESHLNGTRPVDPEEAVEQRSDSELVREALRRLRPEQQRIVSLRDLEAWSYEQIANFEGVTVESVRGALRRARAAFREHYREVAGLPAMLPGLAALRHRWRVLATRFQRAPGVTAPGWDRLAEALMATVAVATAALTGIPGSLPSMPSGNAVPADRPVAIGGGPDVPSTAGATASPVALPIAAPETSAGGEGTTAPASPLPVALPPDGGATPEDAVFHSFASGPDGSLFAAGSVSENCAYPPCAAIFHSADGGATWVRLPAVGYAGGEVLVSPSWPADRRLFASGSTGLQVSDDGGASFRGLSPLTGRAALVPDPRGGSEVGLVVGGTPAWHIDGATGLGSPLTLTPPPPGPKTEVVPLASFQVDGAILVGALAAGPAGMESAVYRCAMSVCQLTGVLSGQTGAPRLLVDDDGSVLAWTQASLFRVSADGTTVERLAVPGSGVVSTVVSSSGFIFVARSGSDGRGGLYRSSDSGKTWDQLGATEFRAGAAAVADTGVALLAAPTTQAGGGLRCSTDGGATWSTRCDV